MQKIKFKTDGYTLTNFLLSLLIFVGHRSQQPNIQSQGVIFRIDTIMLPRIMQTETRPPDNNNSTKRSFFKCTSRPDRQ